MDKCQVCGHYGTVVSFGFLTSYLLCSEHRVALNRIMVFEIVPVITKLFDKKVEELRRQVVLDLVEFARTLDGEKQAKQLEEANAAVLALTAELHDVALTLDAAQGELVYKPKTELGEQIENLAQDNPKQMNTKRREIRNE